MRRKETSVVLSGPVFESLKEASHLSGAFVHVGVKQAKLVLIIARTLGQRRITCIDLDPKIGKALEPIGKEHFIQGSSFDVGKAFKGQCAWIARDSCHCLECTAADIQTWAPKVVKDGYFILYDCAWKKQTKSKQRGAVGSHLGKPSGVYIAMVGSEMLLRDFYLVSFADGVAIWRRK